MDTGEAGVSSKTQAIIIYSPEFLSFPLSAYNVIMLIRRWEQVIVYAFGIPYIFSKEEPKVTVMITIYQHPMMSFDQLPTDTKKLLT